MTVSAYGSDPRTAEAEFRKALDRVDGKLTDETPSEDSTRGRLADLYRDLPVERESRAHELARRIAALKRKLEELSHDESKRGWFEKHLQQLSPEALDGLQLWFPTDELAVTYCPSGDGRTFRSLEQASPGQKTAAILAFLLAHGTDPLILDQPEDDLDNELIYDLIVSQLRANKRRRQVIVVTHNPNIVVNGDSELILIMDGRNRQSRLLRQGSLQSREVRAQVCAVMEGGGKRSKSGTAGSWVELAMFDSKEELLDKISLGEDTVLELKAVRFSGDRVVGPTRDELADELAALANTRDAVLVLGIEDRTREVVGIPIERLDLVEEFVRTICQDSIKPPLVATIIRMRLPGTDGTDHAVIKVDVPRSLYVHKSPGGYFHRVGSSKRELSTEHLFRLGQQRSQSRIMRFDEQVVAAASLDDLDRALYERFRGPQSRDADDDLLHKLAMARPDDQGQLRPTVAGVLLATRDPRRWVTNAFIQAVAYRGVNVVPDSDAPNYQVDAADISSSLDAQVIDACHFVRKNMWVAAAKGEGRRDTRQFDMVTVFEAVVNAVAHRDYSIYASKIRLRMFTDRIEINSPGALANTMGVESLAFRQSACNEAVLSLLAKCEVPGDQELGTTRSTLMDKRGEGVSVILERGERHAGRRPVYRVVDGEELQLTIYGARLPVAQPDAQMPDDPSA